MWNASRRMRMELFNCHSFSCNSSNSRYIYKIFFKHSDMKKIFLIFDTSTIDQQEDIVIALNGLLSMLS